MKPVAIFRFSEKDGPGYLATFLNQQSIPWTLFRLDQNDSVPTDLAPYSGSVFLGGPMSANDESAWLAPLLDWIRRATAQGHPCLGHCLGGQLMAKALGGQVSAHPVKEIGWNRVHVDDSPLARQWLGDEATSFITFQWHGESFTIPPGASRILTADACPNQGFVVGHSLGLQSHPEITAPTILDWCLDWATERADPSLPSVQTPDAIRASMAENLAAIKRLADRLYTKWTDGLPRT